jgi:hypothetical protein
VPGPHGFAVRNNVARPALINHSQPQGRPAISLARNAIASTAARTPRIVTTRTPLFMRRDDGRGHHFRKRRSGLFFTPHLDDPNHVELASEIRLRAQRGFISFASADRVILGRKLADLPDRQFLAAIPGRYEVQPRSLFNRTTYAGQWRPLANGRARLIMIHPPCISDPRSAFQLRTPSGHSVNVFPNSTSEGDG